MPADAFDGVAETYDAAFTDTPLGRLLRARVHTHLERLFAPGEHLLDLACGTGEDAVHLARRGSRITAVDGSSRMLAVAAAKAEAAAVTDRVRFERVDLANWRPAPPTPAYDGAYADFGGINTLPEWRRLGDALATVVRPGGKVLLVPMGRWCPWEVGHYLVRIDPAQAFRRWGGGPSRCSVGDTEVSTWYPTVGRLVHDLSPAFDHLWSRSLGLFLPPSYLGHWVTRLPVLFRWLDRVEETFARVTGRLGDHLLVCFVRREPPDEP